MRPEDEARTHFFIRISDQSERLADDNVFGQFRAGLEQAISQVDHLPPNIDFPSLTEEASDVLIRIDVGEGTPELRREMIEKNVISYLNRNHYDIIEGPDWHWT